MNKFFVKLTGYLFLFTFMFGCVTQVTHPKFEILPDSWDFGNVTLGSDSDKEFTFRNNGTGILSVTSINILTGNATDFIVLNGDTSFEIKRGETHKITVRFTPGADGTRNTIMQIVHNGDDTMVDVQLQGVGTQPQIDIAPTNWDFGTVVVGNSVGKDFEIKNTGTSDLSISSIIFVGGNAGDFAITSGGTSFQVAPGNSQIITVEFTPSTIGIRNTMIQITHNAQGSPYNIQLAGNGTQPQFEITPDYWGYGIEFLGNFKDKEFEIKNKGTIILSVTSIDFIGGNSGDFSAIGGTSFQVNPGSSNKITIRFTPKLVGPRITTMHITHNASGSPTDVILEGIGVIFLTGPGNNTITVNNASEISGIAPDRNNGNIWVSCKDSGKIFRIDYNAPYSQLGEFPAPASNPVGLSLYNSYLYSTDSITKKVYRISTSNGSSSALFDISSYVNVPSGIAFNGSYFYVSDCAGTIYVFTDRGNLVKTINSTSTSIGNVIWDGSYLRIADMQNARILTVDANTGAVVSSLNSPVNKPYALGRDDTNLYAASEQTNIIKKFIP